MPRWKRVLDLTCIAFLAVMVVPVMIVVAVWVKLVSRGPLFFTQERVGLGGRTFRLFKFRSMKPSVDNDEHARHVEELIKQDRPMTKLDDLGDSRLIPGGCFLRALGLDELPQLINVVRGEMSLVGPRPCLPWEAVRYSSAQRERFDTVPGLTGYWQVNGKNRTTFSEMVEMDVHYVRNKSLRMDLAIILRTPFAVLGQLLASYSREREVHQPVSEASPDARGDDPAGTSR